MSLVISIANQKGGVSKSTTSQALITGLANRGYKALGMDLDPQGNLSFCVATESNKPTLYEILKKEIAIDKVIQSVDNFDILPSNILLSGIEVEFTKTGREYLIKESLETVKSNYDFIIIDCPPSLSLLTINAFATADLVIIPMLADVLSIQGITQLSDTINEVKKYCNPNLNIAGILLTKFNKRQKLSVGVKSTIAELAKTLNTKLFNTSIRESVAIREAQIQQQNLLSYDIKSNATIDYNNFIDEFLKDIGEVKTNG